MEPLLDVGGLKGARAWPNVVGGACGMEPALLDAMLNVFGRNGAENDDAVGCGLTTL